MSDQELEPAERYLFLLLRAPGSDGRHGEPVKGNLWLQKELYLVSRNVKQLSDEFEAYRLGPFSEAVEEYESQLRVSQFIDVTSAGIKLTSKGQKIAEEVWIQASKDEQELVSQFKSLLNDLSRDELLVLVYSTFEESTINSDIRAEIEAKRKDVAVSLFRKRKVSLERAAKIAQMSLTQFMKLLKSRNIPAIEITSEEIREELLSASSPSS